MKQLVSDLKTEGSFFKLATNELNNAASDESLLSMKFLSCGINNECSSVVQSQLGRIEENGAVWRKVKEPGLTF